MTHQLVFQFDAQSLDDLQSFLELEDLVTNTLPRNAKLDGHDFGMGEFNIFIHTNDPGVVFEQVAESIAVLRPGIAFAAGLRAFMEEDYISLWPPSATAFTVA